MNWQEYIKCLRYIAEDEGTTVAEIMADSDRLKAAEQKMAEVAKTVICQT